MTGGRKRGGRLKSDGAREIARLRPLTLKAGLSLGDRACLALGKLLGVKVLTTDKAWKALASKLDVMVEVIR